MEDRNLNKCKRCGWPWFARHEVSMICPKCHSYYWNYDEVPKRKRAEENLNKRKLAQ